MKAVSFSQFGAPHEVAGPVDLPEPAAPAAGQVALDLLCSPINPADLLLLSGNYGHRPLLPARAGLEGVGRVTALGPGVTHLAVGDRVLLSGRCWCERLVASAAGLFPLPGDVASEQLAMLTVNPPTAWALLHDFVDLQPGDWVLQNAANSGVGTSLIAIAKRLGWRTISVVRRDAQVADLRQRGGDLVLVDGPDLSERVRAAIGSTARLPLAVDAIGGPATARLALSLDDRGVLVNYGMLSGQDCQVAGRELVFRGLRLEGFWLVNWFARHPPAEIARVYRELAGMLADGTIAVPVEARYPLSRVRDALQHAARQHRGGKVLLVPDAAA